jgi:hypothetical protein
MKKNAIKLSSKRVRLTDDEVERLALCSESCSRVAAEVGWILRDGWESPENKGVTNRMAVEREVGRVCYALDLLFEVGDVRRGEVEAWKAKFGRIFGKIM